MTTNQARQGGKERTMSKVITKKTIALNDLRKSIATLEDIGADFPEIEIMETIIDNLKMLGTDIDESLTDRAESRG